MRKLRVAILFGGRSAEHEISILSARNVLSALDRARFDPVLIGIDRRGRWLAQPESALLAAPDDPRRVALVPGEAAALLPGPAPDGGAGPIDVVIPVLHGPYGEDGTVQGLLELADVPYVGSGVLGSAVGMDKDVSKRLLRDAGLPVADHRCLRRDELEANPASAWARAAEVGFPLFTKPAGLGSSVGVRRVTCAKELPAALAHALELDDKVLAEAAVPGRELECAVLGGPSPRASVPGEIVLRHPDGFYSYAAKYVDDGAELSIPARVPPAVAGRLQALALAAFRALECEGLARVDFFLRPDGSLVVNEVNTMPGFTPRSMAPRLFEASGLPTGELLTRLVELALERHGRRRLLAHRPTADRS